MAKIHTTKFEKECSICGCVFTGTGPAAKYCPVHAEEMRQLAKERGYSNHVNKMIATGQLKKPGSGKGGNPYRGKDHPSYKHGWYVADRLRVEVKEERRYCERCDEDLKDVSRWHWVVHHKDNDHYNNAIENLELLCKRCHQVEHECHKAFDKGATTIPQGSTLK